MSEERGIWWALVISAGLHAGFLAAVVRPHAPPPLISERPYYVRLVEPPPPRHRGTVAPGGGGGGAPGGRSPGRAAYRPRVIERSLRWLRRRVARREAERERALLRGLELTARGIPSRAAQRASLHPYLEELRRRIERAWSFPPRSGWSAVLEAIIDRDGRLQEVRLRKGSGNALFDASAERALRRAAPFPPLPPGWGPRLVVTVRFRP